MRTPTRKGLRYQRKHTAHHEAGHCVIAKVLTIPCGGVTIVPDRDTDTAGLTIVDDPWICFDRWWRRGKQRALDAEIRAWILTLMAGAEAKEMIFGHCRGGEGDDRRQITRLIAALLVTDPDRFERRMRAMTRMLVRRHRAPIERVAKALLAKKTLFADRLDKLVGRSVHDIPIRAERPPPARVAIDVKNRSEFRDSAPPI